MITRTNGILLGAIFAAGLGLSQVPADIAPKLVAQGRNVCVTDVAILYKPLVLGPAPGIQFKRDISYGSDPRMVMDVAWPAKGGNHTVLIYVSGGAGNKMEPVQDGDPFYDNILNWAVKNDMTAVNVQRRTNFGPGADWDQNGKDIATVVQWVHKNIAQYKGNPNRVFIWSHSAGNPPVATYIGRPELYAPDGIELKGAILMSPAPFNLAPVSTGGGRGAPANGAPDPAAGGKCTLPNTPVGAAAAAAGPGGPRGPGGPGGPGGGGPGAGAAKGTGRGGGRGRGGPDPAVQLERSLLPGLKAAKISFLLAAADLDPTSMPAFNETLKEQLCMAGHCPTVLLFKAHSHVSEVFSPNTPDTSVTGPILKWMKSVK